MKTHVEFRSDKFPAYDGEEDQINPGLFGRRLAEYLYEQLSKHNLRAKEISPEDWGWMIPIHNDSFPLWIGCGANAEFDNGFLCFIEPGKPKIRRFFRTIDTTERIEQVASALDSILSSDPEISNVRWWTEDEATV